MIASGILPPDHWVAGLRRRAAELERVLGSGNDVARVFREIAERAEATMWEAAWPAAREETR